MNVLDHINNAKDKTQFSFEILPPLKGQDIQSIFDQYRPSDGVQTPIYRCDLPSEKNMFYKRWRMGLLKKQVVKKRPGTVGICAASTEQILKWMPSHIFCAEDLRKKIQRIFLIDLGFLGIDNVMALRGDAVKSETYFQPEKEGASDMPVSS